MKSATRYLAAELGPKGIRVNGAKLIIGKRFISTGGYHIIETKWWMHGIIWRAKR